MFKVHPEVDQFFRVEQGDSSFVLIGNEEHLVRKDEAAILPAGTHHNVINTSKKTRLKRYMVYSPPHHPAATVHKAEGMAAEKSAHWPDSLDSFKPMSRSGQKSLGLRPACNLTQSAHWATPSM